MILLAAGVLPAFYLMHKIYKLDAIEPEPKDLLFKIFILGGLTTFAAMLLESIGMGIIGIFSSDETSTLYMFLEYFFVVGISEEAVKYFAVKKCSWNHPAFNYRFDGVVYSTAAALGFAAFENVMYILNFGYSVAPIRAITAIPMHCICGIYMGHYYGLAKQCERYGDYAGFKNARKKALYVPVILHGFYDFAASSENTLISLSFFVFVVILDVYSIRAIKNFAHEDEEI